MWKEVIFYVTLHGSYFILLASAFIKEIITLRPGNKPLFTYSIKYGCSSHLTNHPLDSACCFPYVINCYLLRRAFKGPCVVYNDVQWYSDKPRDFSRFHCKRI